MVSDTRGHSGGGLTPTAFPHSVCQQTNSLHKTQIITNMPPPQACACSGPLSLTFNITVL